MSLTDIFRIIKKDVDKTYFIKCSYVEIYNDLVFDLLNSKDRFSEPMTISSN
jgi:hypothetical protein